MTNESPCYILFHMSNILDMNLTNEEQKYFPKIVGQEKAKRQLTEHYKGYEQTSVCPHLLFVAPKGTGKTFLANAFGEMLKEHSGGEKSFLEINCSTIRNVKQFMNTIMFPHVSDKRVTLFFDEASELPKDVEMALLTMLNPNDDDRNTFSHEEGTIVVDFSRQTFLFATTEKQKMFHALVDRCDPINMEEYTYNQLATILGKRLKGVTWGEGVLDAVSSVMRGNAREAQKMSTKIKNYLSARKKNHFSMADWEQFTHAYAINPLGMDEMELYVLRDLGGRDKPCSLTNLSAKTALTKECLQRSVEVYLLKHDLMEIEKGSGRSITNKGRKLLESIDEAGGGR